MPAKRRRIELRVIELNPGDRLSDLPKELICHILSLLPTVDAVRTSVLSKKFRRMWYFVPVLDFDEQCTLRKFCTFVKFTMKLRKMDMISVENASVTRFRLKIKPTWRIINYFLNIVGKSKIQDLELDFQVPRDCVYIYRLSEKSLPVRSLTRLSLTNADLTGLDLTGLRKLESLSLVSVRLSDQVLHGLFLGSSHLEGLVLTRCVGFSNPQLSCLSLKSLEINSTPMQRRVSFSAPNLESFAFWGQSSISKVSFCPNLVSSSIRKLKSLSFSFVVLCKPLMARLIYLMPCLESLTFRGCYSDAYEIGSQRLKRLTFAMNKGVKRDNLEIKIHAPNLVYFRFKGTPDVDFSLRAKNISKANVEFLEMEYGEKWFSGLTDFLVELDFSTNVNLCVNSEEALIYPKELRLDCKIPFSNIQGLKVAVKNQLLRRDELIESLAWMTNRKN